MNYTAKDYSSLLGIAGFSDTLLNNHFTLYQGYVANTNKVLETLNTLLKEGKQTTPEFAELKRRLGWEFNGMRLHELYFDNLGGDGNPGKAPRLADKVMGQFGSIDACVADFQATATMRGIGWVVVYQDTMSGLIINQWINEHDAGHPAGCRPLLVLDVFEHAFVTDYGLKRTNYIAAFMNNLKWEAIEARLGG